MKVFITGVTGFLGRSIARHFLAEGHRIAGSSRRDVTIPGVEIVRAELGDRIAPAVFTDCDGIIHAAHDFARDRMNVNIEGTLMIRDAAKQAGVHQQLFLSSYSARPDTESEYGRTKYRLEQSFTEPGSAIARLGLIIGNGGLFARQRAALLRTAVVPVIGSGGGAGEDPVAVIALSHALAAIEVILRTRVPGPQNLFYEPRPTMKEFVKAIKQHAGQRPRFLPVGPRFAMIAVKIAKAIGLAIPVDPEQIRALQLNKRSEWRSDLPVLLPERKEEFRLDYAIDHLET